jgi:hypothetical protein
MGARLYVKDSERVRKMRKATKEKCERLLKEREAGRLMRYYLRS